MRRNLGIEAQVMFLMGSYDSVYFSISAVKSISDKFCEEHGTCKYSFDEIYHASLMLSDEGCVYFDSKESIRITKLGYDLYADEIG